MVLARARGRKLTTIEHRQSLESVKEIFKQSAQRSGGQKIRKRAQTFERHELSVSHSPHISVAPFKSYSGGKEEGDGKL
jgi:hypothetical protein